MANILVCEYIIKLTNGNFNSPKLLPPSSLFRKCKDARVAEIDVKLTSPGVFFKHTSAWHRRLVVLHARSGCLFIYVQGRQGFGLKLPDAKKIQLKAIKLGPNRQKIKSVEEYPTEVIYPMCYFTAKYEEGKIEIRLPRLLHQEWKHLLADCHDPVAFGLATKPEKVGLGEYISRDTAVIRGYSSRNISVSPNNSLSSETTPTLPDSSNSRTITEEFMENLPFPMNSESATHRIVDKLIEFDDNASENSFGLDTSVSKTAIEEDVMQQVAETTVTTPLTPKPVNSCSSIDMTPPRTPFKRARAVRRHAPSSAILP